MLLYGREFFRHDLIILAAGGPELRRGDSCETWDMAAMVRQPHRVSTAGGYE